MSGGLKYEAKKLMMKVGNNEERWGKEKFKILRDVAVQSVDSREGLEAAVVRCEEYILNVFGLEEESDEIDADAEVELEDFEFEQF